MNNGGPAFPVLSYEYKATGDLHPSPTMQAGMTLRDYFAAKAIQGFLSQSHARPKNWEHIGHGWGEDCANGLNAKRKAMAHTLAGFSYQIADAMIAERSKQ